MLNLYWPVYKNLEKEVMKLSDLVHFDDKQVSVYSVKISELLIRCSVEIESISKDLYFANGGSEPSERDLYFDTDCLMFLEGKWLISKKVIVMSSPNFHYEDEKNRVLKPLYKSYNRGGSGSDWKKAYQAVKHERVKNLSKGNIGNLIRALGTLFILNLYFRNEVFNLGKDSGAAVFSVSCGSDLFSIKMHKNFSHNGAGEYIKSTDFDESIYYVNQTQETGDVIQNSMRMYNRDLRSLVFSHPKMLKFISENDVANYQGDLAFDALGENEYIKLMQQSRRAFPLKWEQLEYEARLNVRYV